MVNQGYCVDVTCEIEIVDTSIIRVMQAMNGYLIE